jgi:hypothetical protein
VLEVFEAAELEAVLSAAPADALVVLDLYKTSW